MKLQLALDDINLEDALELVRKVENFVDIIEVGTPFIIEEGMHAVKAFREHFPDKEILADTKIMDAGSYEAELTYLAGADYCTVLGVTDILTIKGCLEAAQKYGKKVFVDMICVENIEERVAQLEEIGVDCIGVHIGVDQQAAGVTPLEALKRMKKASRKAQISVAGGINEKTIGQYKVLAPDIVIVGGGINHAENPKQAAKQIYDEIKKQAHIETNGK